MKLDKKGITMAELIVSIALITIVVMFLFRLLVDIRYGNRNTDFNRENQQTRAIIMKTIEHDFLEKKLIKIEDNTTKDTSVELEFTYLDDTKATLTIEEESITYTNDSGTEKWLLEKETDSTKIAVQCIGFSSSLQDDQKGDFFSIKINIPIVVNKNSKNTLDDIELFYIGEKKDIIENESFPKNSHLGHYQENTCG